MRLGSYNWLLLTGILMNVNISYSSGNISDPLFYNEIDEDSVVTDSSRVVKPLQVIKGKTKGSGQISLGYQYGSVYTPLDRNSSLSNYFIETTLGIELFKIPFNVNMIYSTNGNLVGINPLFSFSFDSQKYKQNVLSSTSTYKDSLQNELAGLQNSRQSSLQQFSYLNLLSKDSLMMKSEFLKGKKNAAPVMPANLNNPAILVTVATDTLKADSLNSIEFLISPETIPSTDSLLANNSSLEDTTGYSHFKDSILQAFQLKGGDISALNTIIAQRKNQLDSIQKVPGLLENNQRVSKSPLELFKFIKKFEFGLIYPSLSPFLINGVILNGAQVEIQKANSYLALVHGKTFNIFSLAARENTNLLTPVNNMISVFNRDLSEGRRVTSLKFGLGKPGSSHVYIGMLYGKGYQDYYITDQTDRSPENNFVFELDGKWDLHKNIALDVTFAKSTLYGPKYQDELSGGNKRIVRLSERSYAFASKVSFSFTKVISKLTVSLRWVDPFFESYGLVYNKKDCLKSEINIEKKITRKIKIILAYRQEQDNLLGYYNYQSMMRSIGVTLDSKISKNLQVKLSVNPVIQKVGTPEIDFRSANIINYLIVNYNTRLFNKITVLTLTLNDYRIQTSEENLIFQHGLAMFAVSWNSKLQSLHTVEVLNSQNGIKAEKAIITSNELRATIGEKFESTAGIKFRNINISDPGFKLSFTLKNMLLKNMFLNISVEKMLVNRFYTSYAIDNGRFEPYHGEIKLTYNFN